MKLHPLTLVSLGAFIAFIDTGFAQEKTLSVPLNEDVSIMFVEIPAGSFTLGQEDSREDELPLTKVTISKPFLLGKYEVTQRQWRAVMGDNPAYYEGDDRPVEQVSWNDCQEFVTKLNETVEGHAFRLPTEAEWEYACRAGTTTQYSHGDGDENLGEYAWYTGNAQRTTHPVGALKPNPWGLHDMHGNVWEWVQDWYGPYPGGEVTDPSGPESGERVVMRGGSWSHGSRDHWSSYRFGRFAKDFPFRSIGLRLVAEPTK